MFLVSSMSMHAAFLPALLLGAVIDAKPIDAPVGPTYMLWDVSFLGLSEQSARAIRGMLEGELRRVLGPALVDKNKALTPRLRDGVEGCGRTSDCLAEAGGALGLHGVLIGGASVLGDAAGLRLKLIDTRTGKEATAQAMLQGDRAQMLEGMQALIYELLDPSRNHGSLMVDVALEGAMVIVDGQELGRTPLEGPIGNLSPGEHTLKLSSPLIKDYFNFFEIYAGKTTTVRVDLEQVKALEAQIAAAELELPLYKRWWFWAAAAGGASVLAGATVFWMSRGEEAGGAPDTTIAQRADFR